MVIYNIAIIGGRKFNSLRFLKEKVDSIIEINGEPHQIISGGAVGADKMGEAYAIVMGLNEENKRLKVCRPKRWGRDALLERNVEIVDSLISSDETKYANGILLAFPDKTSTGTWHTVDVARKKGLQVIVFIEGKKDKYYNRNIELN